MLLCLARDTNSESRENALPHKQAQLITMYLGLPEKGRAIKMLVVCYLTYYTIPLQADDALASLDNVLKWNENGEKIKKI